MSKTKTEQYQIIHCKDWSTGAEDHNVDINDLLHDDGPACCVDCERAPETHQCEDCDKWARIIDCGCKDQPRPLCDGVCDDCEQDRRDKEEPCGGGCRASTYDCQCDAMYDSWKDEQE